MPHELLKTFGQIAGIGGLAIGVLLILYRDVVRKKIFPQLTKQQAYRLLTLIIVLVWSIAIAGIGAYLFATPRKNHVQSQLPMKFSDLKSAEVLVSEVDDEMVVKVNGQQVARVVYGETSPWVPVTKFLHQGANSLEIQIFNGPYGGCGGKLTLRLNGVEDPQYTWTWFKELGAFANSVCFSQFKTISFD